MRRLLQLAVFAAVAGLLTACGGGIQPPPSNLPPGPLDNPVPPSGPAQLDPPAAGPQPAPVIYAILATPAQGSPGEEIRFVPVLNPGAVVSRYDWDFGDGAAPRQSAAAAPQATCTTPGSYSGSLTVSGPDGQASHSFTYSVQDAEEEPAPPQPGGGGDEPVPVLQQVIIIPPAGGGVSGATVEFSLLFSGKVDSYAWDFGDGASPRHNTSSQPKVTYLAVGEYEGRIDISGPGGSASGKFAYRVYPPGSGGGSNVPPVAALEITPASGFVPLNVTADASASHDPDGSVAAYEWLSGSYLPPDITTEPQAQREYDRPGEYRIQLHVVDNRQHRTFIEKSVTALAWPSSDVLQPGQKPESVSAALVAGHPAVCFFEVNSRRLIYARCSQPDGNGNWQQQTVVSCEELSVAHDAALAGQLAVIAGSPAVVLRESDAGRLYYAFATSSGAWQPEPIELAGMPARGSHLNFCEIDGLACIAYSGPGSTAWYGWRSTGGSSEPDWHLQLVDGSAESYYYYTAQAALAAVGGKPALAYLGGPDGMELRYARADSADASGGWQLSLVDGVPASRYACRLIDLAGLPCIYYGRYRHSDGVSQYYGEKLLAAARRAGPEHPSHWQFNSTGSHDQHEKVSFCLSNNKIVIASGMQLTWHSASSAFNWSSARSFIPHEYRYMQTSFHTPALCDQSGRLLLAQTALIDEQWRLLVTCEPLS